MMKRMLTVVLLGLFALTAGAVSATELVVNGGFESPVLADGASVAGVGNQGGWPLYTTSTSIINPLGDGSASEGMVVPEGSNYMKFTYVGPGLSGDTRSECYTAPTVKVGYTYTLSFMVGKSSDPSKTWTRSNVMFGAAPNGVNFAGASIWEASFIYSHWFSAGEWMTLTYSHTVTEAEAAYAGSPIGVYFTGETWNATDVYYFDNFSITETAVPEPGALVALGGGLAGLAGSMLRRRRSQ